MEFKDYYKIMNLPRSASAEEIKRAYRKLAKKYHPDVSKEPKAEEKFKELGEAYEVLRDPEKRAAYDRFPRVTDTGSVLLRLPVGAPVSILAVFPQRTPPVSAIFLKACSAALRPTSGIVLPAVPGPGRCGARISRPVSRSRWKTPIQAASRRSRYSPHLQWIGSKPNLPRAR